MAEPLISVLFEQLTSAAVNEVKQQVRLVTGVKKEVAKLTNNLHALQAVLLDAEKRQVCEATVTLWLERLKHVSYEMDNVLDEWNTAILKLKIEEEEKKGETIHIVRKKVCFFIPSSCFRLIRAPRVGLRRDIACKIKDLNEKLNEISMEKDKYTFSTTKAIEYERPRTTSQVDVSEIFGRENEKGILISKLLCESSQDNTVPVVIPIVGMGGIGKTTLAQLVYNDDKVKTLFEYRIWVCVSDPFDEIKIAKAILEGLTVGSQNLIELEAHMTCIDDSIRGKRFLLVLDDVWTEDYRKWEQIKRALKSGAVGSRVLVTTRKKEVAIMMRAETQIINLEFLSESVCWLIFSQLAFLDSEKSDELEEIGKQIVRKCKGLPLVAKTLGSLMRFKKSRRQWEEVLRSELWELENVHTEVFVPFLLSYHDLPLVERRCFSFCSIFPKDYEIEVPNLILLWMSQGYFSQSKNLENRGQDCFDNLAMRYFFQDFEKDDDGSFIKCKMHDIVHDFAQFLTKDECLVMETHGDEKRMDRANEKIYHSMLLLESADSRIPDSICNKKNLRTLFVNRPNRFPSLRLDLLLSLTRLRALNLFGCGIQVIPEDIDKLIHLRYLNLSDNYDIEELPETFCNLNNLQTLKIENCCKIQKLPVGMGWLVNLRHLHISYHPHNSILTKGVGRLTFLQTLDEFVVPNDSDENDVTLMKFEDLNKLIYLRGSIFIENCQRLVIDEVKKAQVFKKKEYIVDLGLAFGESDGPQRNEDEDLLEVLEPHPNLKSLKIYRYKGRTLSPNWLNSLTNLKKLDLAICPYCESLPPLGRLPSLESLEIQLMDKVEMIGLDFLGIQLIAENISNNDKASNERVSISSKSSFVPFPKLKLLSFYELPNWKEWQSINSCKEEEEEERSSFTIMPCLSHLYVSSCTLLEALPDFVQNRPNLTINWERW